MDRPPKPLHVRQDRNHMATTFRLVVSCEPRLATMASRALSEAHAEIARLENELSEFRENSPIHRLNLAAPGVRVAISRDALELLERSERLRAATGGAFDCAAKSTGISGSGAAVSWDATGSVAWRNDAGVRLGFGAIGKGYALDRARLILERHGFEDFMLSAGGSSTVLSGFAAPGEPWRWGWSWQKDADGDPIGIPLEHSSGATIALGVSGTQEQGNHLIDARARRDGSVAPRAASRSALVACASAADADALSTALWVAGFEEASRLMAGLPFSIALAEIDAQDVPTWNGVFDRLWGGLAPKRSTSRAWASAPLAIAAAAPGTIGALGALGALGAMTSPLARAEESAPSPGEQAPAPDEGTVDLVDLSAETFAPYVTERQPAWVLLPLFALAIVLAHLKKTRRNSVKNATRPQAPTRSLLLATAALWCSIEQAHAGDLIPKGKALLAVLGTPKVQMRKIDGTEIYYSKDPQTGKALKVAFVEPNTWQKTCAHTWIVGIGRDGKVTEVVAQNQQCPHAKPAAAESFLEQYKGKGPADMAKLKGEINTIAKATGSCELATDAVIHAVTTYQKIKGQI